MNANPAPIHPSERVVLTPAEFASIFGRHYTWAYRQIYAGKVKVISKLGRIMIPRSEVDRLLEEKETYTGLAPKSNQTKTRRHGAQLPQKG